MAHVSTYTLQVVSAQSCTVQQCLPGNNTTIHIERYCRHVGPLVADGDPTLMALITVHVAVRIMSLTQLHIGGALQQFISHTDLTSAVPNHLPPHMRGQSFMWGGKHRQRHLYVYNHQGLAD